MRRKKHAITSVAFENITRIDYPNITQPSQSAFEKRYLWNSLPSNYHWTRASYVILARKWSEHNCSTRPAIIINRNGCRKLMVSPPSTFCDTTKIRTLGWFIVNANGGWIYICAYFSYHSTWEPCLNNQKYSFMFDFGFAPLKFHWNAGLNKNARIMGYLRVKQSCMQIKMKRRVVASDGWYRHFNANPIFRKSAWTICNSGTQPTQS